LKEEFRIGWEYKMKWIKLQLVFFLLLGIGTELSVGRNICPANSKLTCSCSVKSKGLVLICEKGNIEEIKENMRIFKEYPSTVIQYLTLRTVNMPKIPDYVFMGKEEGDKVREEREVI
jgi:hypothetical protein